MSHFLIFLFRAPAPLGSKLCWPPLTKILDLRLTHSTRQYNNSISFPFKTEFHLQTARQRKDQNLGPPGRNLTRVANHSPGLMIACCSSGTGVEFTHCNEDRAPDFIESDTSLL